jgi:hypothetical protein
MEKFLNGNPDFLYIAPLAQAGEATHVSKRVVFETVLFLNSRVYPTPRNK